MAQVRAIAHFMHEDEAAEAAQAMEEIVETESFIVGVIDEDQIDALKEKGLIISVLEDVRPEPIDELIAAYKGIPAPRPEIERDTDGMVTPEHYSAQLAGPLLSVWQAELEEAGASVVEAVGANRFCLTVKDEYYSNVSRLEFVKRLKPLSAEASSPELGPITQSRDGQGGFSDLKIYDLRLRAPSAFLEVDSWLEAHDVHIVGFSARKIRIALEQGGSLLAPLGALTGVSQIEEYVEPQLCNNRARQLVGLDRRNATPQFDLEGEGQIIAVADSGLDDQHPDFDDRIIGLVARARKNDASDLEGHGTHVAATALGSGSASGGTFQGAAPAAQLFFQSISDRRDRLTGLPLDLNELFQEAYDAGARIHNNSWGADSQARYTFESIEADEFSRAHPDMTIVVAAGNEGTSEDPLNASDGFVDWMSVGAPATSKNAITVGASRSDRKRGGYAGRTFGDVWPQDFPNDPIRNEKTSGDPESIAAFSGRGPCADRRIKPDLVAPGTNIVSAKSSRAPLGNFWGSYSGHDGKYAYLGGTSMATPLVSGCAALVREFYQKKHDHNASSSLVKATLINGTRWLSGADATAEAAERPNFHQGFGCLHMPTTLPNSAEETLELRFLDEWQSGRFNMSSSGQKYRFEIDTNGSRELRLCLVWADYPARAIQNNLNLFVQRMPRGQKYMGNEGLPFALRLPDEENNVEVVRIPSGTAGTYLIQISSGNILHPGQPFALVATGAGLSDFRRR